MEQYKLELTQQGKENLTDTINTLMEAAQEIANSSEKDFEQMKSKKWYKRLWEVVTFSKNNQKTTARGVSNLAKLTEIIMKAIVLLANHSEETAKLVSEALNDIENLEGRLEELSLNFKKLALEVKKLKYNYKKSLTLDNLNAEERDIVGSIFAKYTRLCFANGITPNDASRNLYAFAMEGDIVEEDIDVSTHLDKLNPDVQKLLYRLNQSYYYLITGEFDDSDYFDDFSVSVKDIKLIRRHIEETVIFSGAENYAKTLVPDDTLYDLIDYDGLVFEEENKETSAETAGYYEDDDNTTSDDEPELDNSKAVGLGTVVEGDSNDRDCLTVALMCDHVINECEFVDVFYESEYIGKARVIEIDDIDSYVIEKTKIGEFFTITLDTEDLDIYLEEGDLCLIQKRNLKKAVAAKKSSKVSDDTKNKKATDKAVPDFEIDNVIATFFDSERKGNILSSFTNCEKSFVENEVVHVFKFGGNYLGEACITKIDDNGSRQKKAIPDEFYTVSIDVSNLSERVDGSDIYTLIKKDSFNEVNEFAEGEEETDRFSAMQKIFKNYIYSIVTIQSSVVIGGDNKKVRNAISAFAPHVDEDEVLGFYDTTLFGSGKNGYIFTTTGIAYKDMGPAVAFDYDEIFNVTTTNASKDCNKTLLVILDDMRNIEITSVSLNKTPFLEFLEEIKDLG